MPAMEPDLADFWARLQAADHLVFAFPMWWGGAPALVQGTIERLFLPGQAFAYHPKDPFWDKLLRGRSADVLVTMDTPPAVLRWLWGFPIGRRWKRQILGFVGIRPVRVLCFGPVRRGGAERGLPRWRLRLARAAATAPKLKRPPKGKKP
jgi:putative NADPH-quinone reductase